VISEKNGCLNLHCWAPWQCSAREQVRSILRPDDRTWNRSLKRSDLPQPLSPQASRPRYKYLACTLSQQTLIEAKEKKTDRTGRRTVCFSRSPHQCGVCQTPKITCMRFAISRSSLSVLRTLRKSESAPAEVHRVLQQGFALQRGWPSIWAASPVTLGFDIHEWFERHPGPSLHRHSTPCQTPTQLWLCRD